MASVAALIYSSKFLNDESLYEYGEHLLSLRFYRQLVFIIVILPLVLLVPTFNAISAFFQNDRHRFELGSSLLIVVSIGSLEYVLPRPPALTNFYHCYRLM